MRDYQKARGQKTETAKSLDEHLANTVKFVSKDYICYRRDWLYEHLEDEFALLKRCKEMKVPDQKEIEELLNKCKEIKENGRILSSENEE